MTCRQVEQVLAISNTRGTENLTPSVRAHIHNCENCREFIRMVDLPLSDAKMDSNQLDRLQRLIGRDLRPVRRLAPSWVFLGAFALCFAALSCIGVLSLKPYGWFVLMPAQKIAVFTALAASAALLAFSLVRQMVPGQKAMLPPGLLPLGLFVLLCLVIASVFQVRAEPHFIEAGEQCFKTGMPYAVPAAFVFWFILRRGAILSPRVVGAIAGMLAGLVSMTVLEVHCPNLDMWHILVWHLGIALVGLVAGILIAIAGDAIGKRVP